jgi:hypothetical protein
VWNEDKVKKKEEFFSLARFFSCDKLKEKMSIDLRNGEERTIRMQHDYIS